MRHARTIVALAVAVLCVSPLGHAQTPAAKIADGAVKIGLLLDMSSLYADLTGEGSATAARMAIEDFGGSVLGAPIQLLYVDHQNKPDLAAAKAREWYEAEHVDVIADVAASATALAALEVARQKNRIVMFNGPGATRLTNENCSPVSVHYTYDTYAMAVGTGRGVLVVEGTQAPLQWSKANLSEPTRFSRADGAPFVLPDGQVWIELVPTDAQVDVS